MKKIGYLLVFLFSILQSCTKNFDQLNINPSLITRPDAETIFDGVLKNTVDMMGSNNVNTFWEYSHFIKKAGRYNIPADDIWSKCYINILGNTKQFKRLYNGVAGYENRVRIVNIWECYTFAYLVGMYGPIPYSDVLNNVEGTIKFDEENSVYIDILARLKVASDGINITGDKFNPDLLYAGDLTRWKKFANSLRLRIALQCMINIPTEAEAAIRDVMANENMLLSSNDDIMKFAYGVGEGNESQYYVRLFRNTTNADAMPKMSDFIFTYFRSYNDPRMAAFYEPVPVANRAVVRDTLESTSDNLFHVVNYKIPYLGGPKATGILPGWSAVNSAVPPVTFNTVNLSDIKPAILKDSRAYNIMDYAEVCFMKAEARELNFGGTKTAEQYYIDGINANFTVWGLTPANVSSYLDVNGIKWNTSGVGYNNYLGIANSSIPASNMAKIWLQRWINYYPDGGYEAWCLQRRTNNLPLPPHLNPGNPNISDKWANLPDRSEYPTLTKSYNPSGYQTALAFLGMPDIATTPLKFAKPYTRINWNNAAVFYDGRSFNKYYGKNIQDLTAAGVSYTEILTLPKMR